MTANEIRDSYLKFFASKQHEIVPSAPMVVKNDPSLMFTNAGMNQFKDLFLGNAPIKYSRIADSQKCLRVSGKHNDLEEVGHDTYHHTMFEMLGNWSFGDYFKEESISWAWEYLTGVLGIDKECLYATVFEGDAQDGTEMDNEAMDIWRRYLPEERILTGNKKDNFWEMGDTGPCGPCSEIHVDIRSADEKAKIPGKQFVNESHPQVIEIWNLVFIQYNRKANSELELLPAKHVDTGMGFERLCMVVQGKQSNYDTDVFQPIIAQIGKVTEFSYGIDEKTDIAMRVIADHLRTISFAIADGQLPSNNKAGYVIRRILRRAVRYGYTFLNVTQPFMYKLIQSLCDNMGAAYPELTAQKQLIEKVVYEEESSFLRTLETGIKLLDNLIDSAKKQGKSEINGKDAFVLYDTFGFPYDLTELILRENSFSLNKTEFDAELEAQKTRSRQATSLTTDDWQILTEGNTEFVGYDFLETDVKILRYRKVTANKKDMFQIVLDRTPFYGESGGQTGDTGVLVSINESIAIIDTQKENNLIVHIVQHLPENINATFKASVTTTKRIQTACNHSATHLLHKALQDILGTHVEQKGSLVSANQLRFDFAHFQKMTDEEIHEVEKQVNAKIRENIILDEQRDTAIATAQAMGATALFGEKYGETVRVIQFGESIELCGGTHVPATGCIGLFKIKSEAAIAAGIRRIEAVTADLAEQFVYEQQDNLNKIKDILKSTDPLKSIAAIQDDILKLQRRLDAFTREKVDASFKELKSASTKIGDIVCISANIDINDANAVKDLAFKLKASGDNMFIILGNVSDGKACLTIAISETLVTTKKLDAAKIVRECAKEIQGGGGGQAFYATAGGKNIDGLQSAINKAIETIKLI